MDSVRALPANERDAARADFVNYCMATRLGSARAASAIASAVLPMAWMVMFFRFPWRFADSVMSTRTTSARR